MATQQVSCIARLLRKCRDTASKLKEALSGLIILTMRKTISTSIKVSRTTLTSSIECTKGILSELGIET